MTLETIYYIGQTVAVVAIVASLVAIYWQQREANKMARVENAAGLSSNYAELKGSEPFNCYMNPPNKIVAQNKGVIINIHIRSKNMKG